MDELSSTVVDPEELMDLDEGDGSDLDEDEEDAIEDTLPSPLQLPSSGPASTATSVASSPPTNDDVPPVFNFTGKPLNIKRGRGRPRREGGKPIPRRQSSGVRMKRWKPQGFSGRGMPKRVKSFDRDYESPITPSPVEEISLLDPETGALILGDREKPNPHTEELPYAPEQWHGKVCGFCNLGERSQLGQGEMLRLTCPEGFIPQRIVSEMPDQHIAEQAPERDTGDKSPRGPVTCRRQKSFNKCRHPSMTSEYIDELTIIGYSEEPDVTSIFETSGHFYVHRSCALWSSGVIRKENMALENVGQALLLSAARKCSHCNHYGASLPCKKDGCSKMYHFPCATASGAFQELSILIAFCANHLTQAALLCEGSVCFTCKTLGDISNLMYCSVCGEHYHGTCVGLAQIPGVRAGWQCRKCRVCQVCRMIGDESKLMACEQCDKVYHAMCQRPVVTSIPKYGWKCRCCRVCGDCGSRTPGAGLSSRWHSHYTVCDSCYQQRNKGYSCPLCHRAYRAHAYREMVQCVLCRKFVHGTCDPEADLTIYHQRKEAHPEYEYVCSICKNRTQQGRPMLSKRNSTEDPGADSLSASQESLYDDVYEYDPDRCASEDAFKGIGLGRGKPYSASKIAKKRLGLSTGAPGRPKGVGKGLPGKVGFMKRQRLTDFGRKRGPKAKMRGIFGVPGVGLQRPVSDGNKTDEEPGIENRLILCSAKDKFVLTQDICVMCGALGTDQEGCLIACVQCGQCYHPYCVSVKVTKVILQKGWRCLDCTVCEGCGQRNDEGRLLLCDDCDISYHIYCMDPPLNYVPQGTWKCKWCVVCQTCGSTDPGFNCNWMNSFSECGPCASHHTCASCSEPYNDGDLIIQCVQCERWLHGLCDSIKTEADAEKCAEDGYNCVLCRPRDVPPPHLLPAPAPKPPSPTKSPEVKSNAHYYIDGVYLSETGHSMIKSLCLEQQIGTRKKRKKISSMQDKEAGIMATIESVIAGSSGVSDNGLEDNAKLELIDVKDEPQELYKEGMLWAKEDGPPPEGFTLFTMENGMTVLRRKRQRNLQKLGIGGFFARIRGVRSSADNEDFDLLTGQSSTLLDPLAPPPTTVGALDSDKPRRKPIRRKPKSKLAETFPPYLQEAFFGKELLDSHKDLDSTSGSDDENTTNSKHQMKSIQLSQDEIKAVAAVTAKQDSANSKSQTQDTSKQSTLVTQEKQSVKAATIIPKEEEESDTDDLSLALPRDLLDADLVNTIMNEEDDELTKNTDTLENLAEATLADAGDISDTLSGAAGSSKDTKDELSDILLGSNFNPESIPYINSKDVEDILFKGVLTDESQESQESNIFSTTTASVFPAAPTGQQPMVTHPISVPAVRPSTLPNVVNQNSLSSPLSFPPQSPYQSEYSNSPQFSPAFSEPPSPWVTVNDASDLDNAVVPSTYNQRSSEKMKADEGLGSGATISAVLYANMNHPEWKNEYPSWSDRYKQIIKKWRTLSPEQKAPYLLQAKDNRSALRMKKQQQISGKESGGGSNNSNTSTTTTTTITTTALTNPGMAALPPSSQHHNAKASPLASSSMSPSPQQATTATMILQQQQSSQLPVAAAALIQNPSDTSVTNNTTASTLFQQSQQQLGQQQQQQQTVHHQLLQKDHHHLHQHHQIQAASSVLSATAVTGGSQEVCNNSKQTTIAINNHNSNNNNSSNISTNDSSNFQILEKDHQQQQQQQQKHQQPNHNAHHQSSSSSNNQSSATIRSSSSISSVLSHHHNNHSNSPISSTITLANNNNTNNNNNNTLIIAANSATFLPTSPSITQQQFTVHGTNHHFLGSSDHSGPAPNVTVNPHYQPTHGDPNPRPIPLPHSASALKSSPSTAAVDQQIRVLTPSEIMRTLPSLCQEGYETPSPIPILDPEKSVQQQKSAREAEQERQWKQLQALRQQQQQHQQQIIQEQRVQARVHRSISDSGVQQFLSPEQTVVQSSPQPEITSPHHPASPRTFNTLGIKSPPTFTHPASVPVVRPPTPQQQPVVTQDFISEGTDPFSPTPAPANSKATTAPSNLRLPVDPYSHQPATPRPVPYAGTPRPTLQGIVRQDGGNLEINHRQLKDLLQRQQQFKKLDEQLLPGKGQQRVWPPPEAAEGVEQVLIPPSSNEPTFRHPLPPAMRPRIPLPTSNVIRQSGIVGLRMQTNDPRLQGLRLILHQQQQQRTVPTVTLQQPFPPGTPRFPQNVARPAGVEQYEQIQRQVFQPRTAGPELQQAKLHLGQQQLQKAIVHQSATALATVAPPTSTEPPSGEQEIPDNVTAELEKLEQDGTMVELQGVGDLLGGLPEDDDELLAEMGNDFNILEYADPELDALTGGEKTNILDSLDLVEPEPVKEEKKLNKNSSTNQVTSNTLSTTTTQSIVKTEPKPLASSTSVVNLQLPPLTVSQQQPVQQPPQPSPTPQPQVASQQQIHQQMLQNVQQATADGRPFLTRTRIMTREGIVGTVMTNNNVINVAGYPHQQLLGAQMQIQKLQMRQNAAMVQNPRLAGPVIHGTPSRINVAAPPPPPPYPGPPPPYPGSTTPQMGLRMAGPNVVGPPLRHPAAGHVMHPAASIRQAAAQQQGLPMPLHQVQRRPLLLEEQPLLLQELLEEEQREQEKQLQSQSMTGIQNAPETSASQVQLPSLSDHDFERLKADVLSSGPLTLGGSTTTAAPVAAQNVLSSATTQTRPTFQTQVSNPGSSQSQWQTPQTPTDTSPRVPTFTANFVAAPPLPPEHIVTEQDKQTQNAYEQWLNHQNMVLGQQLKFYEGEVQKLRKMRKSLNSKQRQLRKCGNQLPESDATELQRIATEQSVLQKHLESSRKQSRQHGMLIQEYRNKQQAKQRPGAGQSPLLTQSPLGPPVSSPIHPPNTPQSPMMSPTASPMTQHSSPMHSPAPLVSHSPGPGSVSSVLQSPSNATANVMSPMQPSPRIGTPHSQSEGSPGPVQSPSQICLPPPMPRMTSPQHRRVVTSPIGYAGDLRPGTPQTLGQLRFARPQLDAASLQQRTRLQSPSPNFQQKPCTPSPLNSPPTQQMTINQQMLQRHLQQQALLQQQQAQQQQQQAGADGQSDCTLTNSQRTLQLIQQRQLALRQQQLAQQQQQQQQGGAGNQPQPLTPQQHQIMVQQQQQLAKQQQQQIAQIQAQVRISQQHNQPPSSPMPPSPHVNQSQIMSPHSMHSQPASPMPPRSPMVSNSPVPRSPAIHQTPTPGQQPPNSPMMHSSAHQPPNSPMPRSPMVVGQIQSPMGIRRPPSTGSSPVIPDRPRSVENPGTPRTIYHQMQEHDHTGGGNPHNPSNPIPFPPGFGRFGYFKLGLRGGSPMWGYGRGAKRLPNGEGKEEKPSSSEITAPLPKFKKESHVSRVTILKKKSPAKSNLQGLSRVNSLVSSDYNEFDDSSSTPPITPPPSSASTSGNSASQRPLSRSVGKKLPPGSNHQNEQLQVIDRSPEDKQLSIMDYDDDTVISTEVSLSSAAQQADCEEITVIESFNQTGLESFSSPLESDQIPEDFLLFDISEKEMEDDEAYHVNDNNVRFVLHSPTSSDDELHGLQGKLKQSDALSLNLLENITASRVLPSESPIETEEPPHLETAAEENFVEESSHLVIIDTSTKSPEEISTKEDFEELIDEGSRKEKIIKPGIINSKHINEIHKYAAPNVYSFTSPSPRSSVASTIPAPSTTTNVIHTNVVQNIRPNTINIRPTALQGPKISLIATTPVIAANSTLPTAKLNKNIMQSPKVQNNIASIIFPIKTTLRSNVIGVPKIVNSVAPAITIVSGTTTQIANIIPSHFTVPVISASAVSKLPNVKVIDKPSTSLSLTSDLPKKIFEDDSKSPDSSNCEEDKMKLEQHLSKLKEEQQRNEDETKAKDTKEEYEIVSSDVKKEGEQKEPLGPPNNGGNAKSSTKNKTSPLIIHNPPELKMTAQVIQESQALIRSTTLETFITQAVEEVDGNSNDLDNKSVVISIPSPTPSQEQILDHISLQALENRRQDGKFEYFDTLLEMIEDMDKEETNNKLELLEPPTIVAKSQAETVEPVAVAVKVTAQEVKEATQIPVSIVTNTRATVMPQLSPLSQPSELTSNIANGSQQLRTLLSSFTTTVTSSSNVGTVAKTVSYNKEKTTNLPTSNAPTQIPRIISQQSQHNQQQQQQQSHQHQQQQQSHQHQQQQQSHQHQQQQQSHQHQQQQQSHQHQQQQQSHQHQQQQQSHHQQQQQSHQHQQQHQAMTNATSSVVSSVIVTNIKQKVVSPKTSPTTTAIVSSATHLITTSPQVQPPSVTVSAASTTQSLLNSTRPSLNVHLISDHAKLSHPMQVSQAVTTSLAITEQKTMATSKISQASHSQPSTPTTTSTPPRKTSLSLNEMLQSHPAATVPQTSPGTITTASILGSALPLSRSGFSAALVQAQPHVISSVTSSVNTSATQPFKPALGTTNLLHSQLTKTPVSRTRSFDEIFEKRIEREPEHSSANTSESSPSTPVTTQAASSLITTSSLLKDVGGCKFSTLHPANRLEDSQNVLLKQLLQNTACASLQTTTSTTVSTTTSLMTAPSLPIVPNLEAQLARPVPPTPSSLIPPILQNDTPSQQQQLQSTPTQAASHPQTQQQSPHHQQLHNISNNNHNHNNNNSINKSQIPQITQSPVSVVHQRQPIMTRETSFVSKPVVQNVPVSLPVSTSHQQTLHIDIKRALPPSRTPSRDDLLSPPTPRSTCSQDSNLTTPPLTIKKESNVPTTLQSPLLTPQEVKKEFLDESSQHSEVSDQSRCDVQMKEELMDIDTEKMDKEELKKMKRRMYQQKRRQNQILNKEIAGQPKKRPRKSSKVDEDYDSYIEGVLAQLRTLPPMVVSEPILNKNFGVVSAFGSGDLTKLGCKDYDSRFGDLKGNYGNAEVPGYSDYYSTKPYGEFDPLPEKPPSSTQRGFYDQEFPLIKFDVDEDRRFDLFCRDDSPDSVISSSSPECPIFEPILKFPGLKLIDEEDETGEEMSASIARPLSPIVPIVAPIPIRLKPNGPYLKDYADMVKEDKENIGKDYHSLKTKFSPTPTTPLKDSGNVTVTLTLTSSAAEDIMGVLRDLANILHIPAPTSYQIVERTSTPPSQKLGLYRTKGKDGKEGAPIDIQSILNGAAKFCKHCDVVILNNMIRKKISELPFLSKDTELLGDGDELFFCSSTCYMQFALMHRSPSLTEDKAAAIVDHLCQKDKADHLRKKQVLERQRAEVYNFEAAVNRRQQHFLEKMDIDLQIKKEEFPPDDMHLDFMKPDCFLERTQKVEDPPNKWRNQRYKKYAPGCLQPRARYKKASDKETMELLYKLGVTVAPIKNLEDTRKCMFCHNVGDGVADGPARLLNFDVDKWVHLNCALWSDGVYETVNGALMQLENALQQSLVSTCVHCNNLGATIRCFKTRCSNIYHLSCAIKDRCVFYKNKTTYCVLHIPKNEKDNELTTLSVSRRVYVNRDENRQVAAVMHHSDQNNLLRVGSLIFLSVGQLLPHQLQNFHTSNFIYPIGYKIVRFYWSMRHVNKRCRYICSIHEILGRPEFRILVQEVAGEEMEFRDSTARGVWNKVIEPIANLRKENQCVHVFPKYVTGEDLFGLTEPAVVRVLESLPGIETLSDYKFKYGRNPLLELPLAINPSGAARTEPRLRNQLHWKRAHTQRTGSSARPVFAPTAVGSGEVACPYSKQFVHSKSSQYKKMKQEWRNNVYLARSKIQGLGLYAARDLEKHTMVIEYIGEIIRTELAETREKKYEAKNRGIYMFRLDEERVVDATLSGGLARYINHSCNPNCVAEIVEVDRDLRIIIFAKRRIQRGEELAYDYKFDIEDDQHKISCMCGAPNCRKWMN